MFRDACNRRSACFALALALCVVRAEAARAGDLSMVEAIGRDTYAQMVMDEARRQGVPPALADAVAVVESGYNVMARGTSGEVGLMQILPATAMQLGFSGTTDALFVPWTNIHFGVAYLARAWSLSGGSVCRALMKYRAGWGQEDFSPLSIDYCARASAYLDGQGVASLDGAPAAAPPPADPYVIHVGPALKAQAAQWRAMQRHF